MNGAEHAAARQVLNGVVGQIANPGDRARVEGRAAEVATNLVEQSQGRIDVVADLIRRTAAETCIDYFGLEAPDPDALADWTIGMSRMIFADPFGKPETRSQALQAARHFRAVVERSLDVAEKCPGANTVIDRLLALKKKGGITHAEIITFLTGNATGMIPTTTIGMTAIIEELLSWPEWWEEARHLARAAREVEPGAQTAARARLREILMEAARLSPTLYPGQFRIAAAKGVIAEGTLRAAPVKAGDLVMVATASALRDGRRFRRPNTFNPDRPLAEKQAAEIMFGWGDHKCVGIHLAVAVMVEIAVALFSREELAPAPGNAGKVRSAGPFPRHMEMTWKPDKSSDVNARPVVFASQQTLMVIAALLPPGANPARIQQDLQGLRQSPAKGGLGTADIVHFASFSVLDLGTATKPEHWLMGDLNVDGDAEAAIPALASGMTDWLPVFRQVDPSLATTDDLARFLKKNVLDIRCTPWGATGLQYPGSIGISASDIRRQKELADFVREVIDSLNLHGPVGSGLGARDKGAAPDALSVLDTVRRLIRQDPGVVTTAPNPKAMEPLLQKGAAFRSFLIRPRSQRLAFADYVTSRDSENPPPGRVAALIAADRQRAITFGVLLALAVGIVAALRIFPGGGPLPGALDIAGILGESLIWVSIATLVTAGLAAGLFTLILLAHEAGDRSDPSNASPAQVTEVETFENEPGYAQNHMISVTRLKAGPFRRYTLALGMWIIRLLALFAFRPGNLARMGTIHFARWVKPPGAKSMVFLSNYDGSWLSYLEDFTALASVGLNLAWGHSQGAPTPRLLVLDGASDPDAFKRFAKRSLQKTNFWFSGYPGLTLENIRRNALIHDGLMRAANASEARDWLDMLASVKRPDREIETPEIQTLILRGLGSLPAMACGLVRLDPAANLVSWTDALTKTVNFGNEDPDPHRWEQQLWSQLLAGDRRTLPEEPTATFVAFTATGLTKLGLPAPDSGMGLGAFLAPFNQGMGGRSRVLRDGGPSSPTSWQWSDSSPWTGRPEGDRSVDAVLLVYGVNPETCQAVIARHVNAHGLSLVKMITSPVRPVLESGLRAEPFGFADGISNPAIKGLRGNPGLPADQVSPGEILLGYPHMRGGLPPTCEIPGYLDPLDILPAIRGQAYRRYPAFGRETGAAADHDFGRNGTFLVVRQLEQDVAGFIDYTRQAAAALLRQAGAPKVDADWVAAKMVGRWRDGSPVVLYPDRQPRKPDTTDDFLYATLDPRGFACPLGSHVRRTNPRDSLIADDLKTPNHISSHRILRRGRAYAEPGAKGESPTEGLIFLAACSDLERQFEFVQQTWIGDPSFHGLTGESDPLVDTDGQLQDLSLPDGRTVRRLKGIPDFVTVRGGGYFFMPSRSALYYLVDRARRIAPPQSTFGERLPEA
jgi:Dyp-type peroxidase family